MAVIKTPLELKLFNALARISRDYRSSESLLRKGDCGLDGPEALEAAYDNIQWEAKSAIRGVRAPKPAREITQHET